jgi:hypothetical protein
MLDVVVDEMDDAMKKEFSSIQKRHKDIKMRLIQADIHSSNVIAKLKPEHYDNVIILSGDGGESELRDSETIARLLEFRHYFRENVKGEVKTQLITEVADSDNTEIIQEAGVHDFLISNQFVSKIYAQVSEEPAALNIYEDLFSEEGCELYIKPAALYISGLPASLSFADICAAALRRNETCLGVRLASESHDASSHYGIHINPEKSAVFELSADDMLITLAEDES